MEKFNYTNLGYNPLFKQVLLNTIADHLNSLTMTLCRNRLEINKFLSLCLYSIVPSETLKKNFKKLKNCQENV